MRNFQGFDVLAAGLAAALAAASMPAPALAQDFLAEETHRCLDFEMEVWGEKERRNLFRSEEGELRIEKGAPVVWFCGRARNEFFCHPEASLLRIAWNRDGQVVLRCYRQ